MDKPIEFRTSMRGYNKEDVNSYISNENIRFNRTEASYNKTIEDLEKKVEELNKIKSESEKKDIEMIHLNEVIISLRSDIDRLNEKISENDTVIEGLRAAISDAEKRNFEAEERIQTLDSELNDAKLKALEVISSEKTNIRNDYSYDDKDSELNDNIIEKAKKYDEISAQIDEILECAKSEAEKIITSAIEYQKAVSEKMKTKKESLNIRNDIQKRSDSIIDDLKRSIKKQFKGLGK